MARLNRYTGPPEYEQQIIKAIKSGSNPAGYTMADIIEDEEGLAPSEPRRSFSSGSMKSTGGMMPGGYQLKPNSVSSSGY